MQRMFEKLSTGFSRYNARLQTVFEIITKVSFSKYVGQGSAVVEPWTHNPQIEDSNPAADTHRLEMAKKIRLNSCLLKLLNDI
jgi:hypothetical protein